MHLQTLVAAGDLVQVRLDMGQPAAYLPTARVFRRLDWPADPKVHGTRPLRYRRSPGSHFVHELLLTEFAVSLTEAARSRPDLTIRWDERFGFTQREAFRDVIPDYLFLLQHRHGLLAYLLEVFSGEESSVRMGQKLERYALWAAQPATQEYLTLLYASFSTPNPRPAFRLLIVVHDRRARNDRGKLIPLLARVAALPRAARSRTWLTTVADLELAASIDDPIWLRAKDLGPFVLSSGQLPRRERREAFRRLLDMLPRHRLFPSLENAPGPADHAVERLVKYASD